LAVDGHRHVLRGVRRLTHPVTRRVPASPTLKAILALFDKYWSNCATAAGGRRSEDFLSSEHENLH
jgi:hypothetical protein